MCVCVCACVCVCVCVRVCVRVCVCVSGREEEGRKVTKEARQFPLLKIKSVSLSLTQGFIGGC